MSSGAIIFFLVSVASVCIHQVTIGKLALILDTMGDEISMAGLGSYGRNKFPLQRNEVLGLDDD